MIDSIKQNILKYWFYISSFSLAILWLLFDKRGRELQQVKNDAQRMILSQKLLNIKSQSEKGQEEYEKAIKSYNDLRSRHGDILLKLGIATGTDSDSTH
jgi:hypothetical protein